MAREQYASDRQWRAVPKMVKAKCTKCPYVGRSASPEYYRCGYCYNADLVAGLGRRVDHYESLAGRKRAERRKAMVAAREFLERHPECADSELKLPEVE